MQEAGFVLHCKSQQPVPSTKLSLLIPGDSILYFPKYTTVWVYKCNKMTDHNAKSLGFPYTHILNVLVLVLQSVIFSSEKQFLISLLCFISMYT